MCLCVINLVLYVCLLTERLDEILASQETVLRPKVEADYRAATVKQRPTSRRMTPAEISVRYSMCIHTKIIRKCLISAVLTRYVVCMQWSSKVLVKMFVLFYIFQNEKQIANSVLVKCTSRVLLYKSIQNMLFACWYFAGSLAGLKPLTITTASRNSLLII